MVGLGIHLHVVLKRFWCRHAKRYGAVELPNIGTTTPRRPFPAATLSAAKSLENFGETAAAEEIRFICRRAASCGFYKPTLEESVSKHKIKAWWSLFAASVLGVCVMTLTSPAIARQGCPEAPSSTLVVNV